MKKIKEDYCRQIVSWLWRRVSGWYKQVWWVGCIFRVNFRCWILIHRNNWLIMMSWCLWSCLGWIRMWCLNINFLLRFLYFFRGGRNRLWSIGRFLLKSMNIWKGLSANMTIYNFWSTKCICRSWNLLRKMSFRWSIFMNILFIGRKGWILWWEMDRNLEKTENFLSKSTISRS